MGIKTWVGFIGWIVTGWAVLAEPTSLIPQSPEHPSPWWIVDRFGRNLVSVTEIDHDRKQVLLTIDAGVWASMDYLSRFSTLQHLSSAAIPHSYSLVMQDKRKVMMASYSAEPQKWTIMPENLGALPLRPLSK